MIERTAVERSQLGTGASVGAATEAWRSSGIAAWRDVPAASKRDRSDAAPAPAGPAPVGPGTLGPAQVGPAQVGPAQVGPVPVGLVREVLDLTAQLGEHDASDPLWPLTMRRSVSRRRWPAPQPGVSLNGASRLLRCADGWIAVSLARQSDVELLPAWLDAPPAAFDSGLRAGDSPLPGDELWSAVAGFVSERSGAALIEQATLLGLPCAQVGEQRDTRRVIRQRFDVRRPSSSPQRSTLRVVNLASLWAGPLAARLLARRGHEVITVESAERPDGARADPEWFAALHEGCSFVRLEFTSSSGRRDLRELLASADIIIEGSRPRALAQLGIDAARLLTEARPRVWVSITAHGRQDGAAHRVGFGDDAAAAGGLVSWPPGTAGPEFIADAVADPLAGLTAAAATIDAVADPGAPVLLDVALSRVAAAAASANRLPGVTDDR